MNTKHTINQVFGWLNIGLSIVFTVGFFASIYIFIAEKNSKISDGLLMLVALWALPICVALAGIFFIAAQLLFRASRWRWVLPFLTLFAAIVWLLPRH